ncbi:putative ribonuclease H-like domain-containing protein [Lupinus albus]|uniref:Putative ribonuclease H-like domain-containing protein n=1 Tax=Lupinus albus TaxID=3870 RepID=A0A6A4QP91_LUPAL|nr:putative ribonuclease H-like domain-containing protein [Lupinus albus]
MARSAEYFEMFELVAKHGPGFKPPSYYEIRVKNLKEEVKFTHARLEEHKAEWKKVGCTIMTDGWTDKRMRTILNFLVHSPKGTVFLKSIDASHISKTADMIFKMIDEVVEEIGEDKVQVVTDNASNYKVAGEMLFKL